MANHPEPQLRILTQQLGDLIERRTRRIFHISLVGVEENAGNDGVPC